MPETALQVRPAGAALSPDMALGAFSFRSETATEAWLPLCALPHVACAGQAEWEGRWDLREADMAHVFHSELLEEFEDKVPQSYPEHLVIVTDDVG